MVLKITKETWEKCGIKTVKYYGIKRETLKYNLDIKIFMILP